MTWKPQSCLNLGKDSCPYSDGLRPPFIRPALAEAATINEAKFRSGSTGDGHWIRRADKLRVVDLATGSGDIPRLIVDYARKISATVEIDALDRQPATLEIARRLSADYPEISYREVNILEWNSVDAYDIALCTLALHHFSNEDAVRLLRKCCQVSKRFVLVSDLRRSFSLVAGVSLLTTLIFREPMTRYDARLSSIRAFSFPEMRDLAVRAGWKNFGHKRFRFGRQAIWLEAGGASSNQS